MLDTLRFRALNGLWRASRVPAHRAFLAALDRPAEAQASRLAGILRRNAASRYGRRFGFARLGGVREYQDAVPVVTAEELAPEIEAIKDGHGGVLTVEPVRMLEQTGGSAGGVKHVPYTASLLGEIQAAIGAWIADLHGHRPALARGGAYWSVSPLARRPEVTRGGLAVGFGEDTEYFGRLEQWLLRRLILTPPELPRVEDLAASRYVTLRFLLDSPHLAFVSVWSPSFLTLLMDALDGWTDRLLDDVERGRLTPPAALPAGLAGALAQRLVPRPARAAALRAAARRRGRLEPRDAWPALALISCWTSAAAARAMPDLRARFPGVAVQGKGLLATEGVVSIPLSGHAGAALAVTSHFYEFQDVSAPGERPRLAHELAPGGTYAVILTTGGGLYRYALGDAVRVLGHAGRTPLLEFVGRLGIVSDLFGEKLADAHVAAVLEQAAAALGIRASFLMLAPEWGRPPHYVLLAEAPGAGAEGVRRLAAAVEERLLVNPSYAYCRRLGQLDPVRGFRLEGRATAAYLDRCAGLGQRAGAIKPCALHREAGWTAHLAGALV